MCKKILAVALAVLMLFLAYPASAATQVDKVEVRGTVFDEATQGGVRPSWDTQSFAGFYYDIKYNRSTETMSIDNTLAELSANSDTIAKEKLWYNTTIAKVDFKVREKESTATEFVTVDGNQNYSLVGWQAEKWIGIKDKANKIAKLAFEMDKEDKKTLTSGETWSLGSGYELTVNAVDARANPRQAWFTLKKDGAVIDEGIGQAPAGASVTEKQKAVYKKTKTIMGESDALLFTVYVDSIFSGATSDMVQFKYAWLIDENSAKEIKSADRYGVFEVRTADSNNVRLSNENTVSLSKNTETTIMGEIKFKVADNDTLRFYPKVDYVVGEPGNVTGTATVTGTVRPTVNVTTNMTAVPTIPVPTGEVTAIATTVRPPPPTATPTEPGFEAMFAIAGLLAVAYLVLRQRK